MEGILTSSNRTTKVALALIFAAGLSTMTYAQACGYLGPHPYRYFMVNMLRDGRNSVSNLSHNGT